MSQSFALSTRAAAAALVALGALALGPAALAQPYGKGGNYAMRPAKPASKPDAICKTVESKTISLSAPEARAEADKDVTGGAKPLGTTTER